MRLIDAVIILGAAAIAYDTQVNQWPAPGIYELAVALGLLSAILFFDRFSIYRAWRGISAAVEVRTLIVAWLATGVATLCILAATGSYHEVSTAWLSMWMITTGVALAAFRLILRSALRWARAEGYNQRRVVLVGMSARGLEIAQRIRHANWTGLQVAGYFDERGPERTGYTNGLGYLGRLSALSDYVERERINQVWIVYPLKAEDRVKQVLHELRHTTVTVRYVLDIFAFDLVNHSIDEVAGVPILNLNASPLIGVNALMKEIEDRLLAGLILAVISPLMIAIALGVKLSSPGPIFYRQERIGWNNRPFTMLKFRSMPINAEAASGPVWAKPGEQRATKFGAFLRKTSLDELPQFINVLLGDMSIVGPRPERPVFVDKFKDEIPAYMKKHMVKAGITGWAQVHGWRGDTDLAKRIEYDLYYIEHWSLWLDLKIVAMTFLKGFINRNAY